MAKYKKYLDIWFAKGTKHIGLLNYKEPWKEVGIKPMWEIRTNGGKRKNGDTCFDFFIHFGYLVFNYTNFELQGGKRGIK